MREDAWDHLLEDRASRISVVLVDDDPADARLVQEMVMGGHGDRFELTRLSRLSEARSHLSGHGAACVLLDLSLPDAVGLEGLEALRAEFGEIPIVIITAWMTRTLRSRGFALALRTT